VSRITHDDFKCTTGAVGSVRAKAGGPALPRIKKPAGVNRRASIRCCNAVSSSFHLPLRARYRPHVADRYRLRLFPETPRGALLTIAAIAKCACLLVDRGRAAKARRVNIRLPPVPLPHLSWSGCTRSSGV